MKTVVLFGFVLGAMSAAGRVIVAKPGETVTLDCGISRYSSKVEWHRENNLIRGVDRTMRGVPRKSSGKSEIVNRSTLVRDTYLKISGVKAEDAGKFSMLVDGATHYVTLVVVSVSASPSTDLQLGSEVTLRCQIRGLNPEPRVQWIRPDGNQGPTESVVQLKPVTRSDGGTWNCTISQDDWTHVERLEIKVSEPLTTPSSASGHDPSQKTKNGPKINCPNCAIPSPPKSGQLLGLSWWMWVIVGVGSLVVVLLLVVVICLYKRIKRKRRKLLKMKNSRLPLTTKPYCQCDRPTAAAKPQQGRRREKPSAPPLQPLLME